MKEHVFIKLIKEELKNNYLGDDCAYLKDLEIVITQDNFIQDVHFKTEWATPFQIGYKAAVVNISDILAAGAKPKYLTIGLSLPKVSENFIKELYKGFIKGAHGAKIIGGDITRADKIVISIAAIGTTRNRKISSRSNAKPGYVVISSGSFGDSAKGFEELENGIKYSESISAHLEPILDFKFSEEISTQIKVDYAMMDTSDGLADALFQIAKASNVKIIARAIEGMFGFEDYKLVAAVPQEFLKNLDNYNLIGEVVDFDGSYLQINNKNYCSYDELGLFDHFNS